MFGQYGVEITVADHIVGPAVVRFEKHNYRAEKGRRQEKADQSFRASHIELPFIFAPDPGELIMTPDRLVVVELSGKCLYSGNRNIPLTFVIGFYIFISVFRGSFTR